MSYSFQKEVISRLPAGHKFVRLYSISETECMVETVKDATKRSLVMKKVDLSTYFLKIPTIAMGSTETYNDLYQRISDMFGLDLQKGNDYYDSSAIKPTTDARYVELPIGKDSRAYMGFIRCYVTSDMFTGTGVDKINRDLRGLSGDDILGPLKVRMFFSGNLFTIDGQMFLEDKLSDGLIEKIVRTMYDELGNEVAEQYRTELVDAVISDTFNDGVSDIVLTNLPSNGHTFIRFISSPDDLPLIKNNEDDDHATDTTQVVLVGDDDQVLENPDEGKGETNIQQSDSDIPNPSVVPVTPKKKSKKK